MGHCGNGSRSAGVLFTGGRTAVYFHPVGPNHSTPFSLAVGDRARHGDLNIPAPPILRVLVVEDEDLTRQAIAMGLRSQGFEVGEAANAAACLQRLAVVTYDVVLLDLGLPDADGVSLAFELRRHARLGLIVVTRRAEIEARIEALDVGADDYLVKPVHPAELAARIRSVVRRRGELPRKQMQLGPWLVDLEARTVRAEAGDAGLTRGEFDILARLVAAEGRVVNREDLLEAISRRPLDSDPRSVDMLVSRLRRKLGGTADVALILTVAGYGYRLAVAPPLS